MSSRVLRKLHADKDLEKHDGSSETETDLTVGGGARRKNINPYDLLVQESRSESEVKEDDSEMETADAGNGFEGTIIRSKRKKKKRRKKTSKLSVINRKSSDDNFEELVDETLEEVHNNVVSNGMKDIKIGQQKSLLEVRRKHLNPMSELKQIFGSRIVHTEQSRRRGHGRPYVKQPLLIKPRENWLPVTKTGISMRLISGSSFTYEHNPTYREIQKKFLEAVDSFNPDNIVSVVNSHPYHVDALIQLSDLCKLSDDLQMAAELNERALHCLESAFHPTFNLLSGNCSLDYKRQENRALFITLFKHLTFVGQRACYRTALELCKVLLSLDFKNDPLAVILCIDFYALRSKKYTWLMEVVSDWELTRKILVLPNFAYSYALALFREWEKAGPHEDEFDSCTVASGQLQYALLMFPGVLMPLLEKCRVEPDPRVARHSYFTSQVETSQSQPLGQLVKLYVSRTYHEWKYPEVIAWLEKNSHKVLDIVDSNDPRVTEFQEKRNKSYMKMPRNVLRHIVLSDLKDVTITLPSDLPGPVLSFDPFPPLDSIDIYTRPRRVTPAYERSNALSMFFRSLMPNFNLNPRTSPGDLPLQLDADGEVREAEQENRAAALPRREEMDRTEAAGAAGNDLHTSVTSLLDAMRELLSNIHYHDIGASSDGANTDTIEAEDEEQDGD